MIGVGELGSTTDPLALIGGSVQTLRADADDLRTRAAELTDEADGPVSRAVTSWASDNATVSAQNRAALAEGLNGVAAVYGAVATVLDAHADTLGWAQGRAQVAIDLWAEGVSRGVASGAGLPALRPHVDGPFGPRREVFPESDAGAPLRRLAEALLGEARGEVRFSQAAAARVLDEFCAGMPDGQFHFDEFLAGIGDWVTGIADLAWRFSAIRLMVDGDAVVADAQAMGQGLWDTGAYLAADPTEAVPVLFNTQLMHDRPGRWWGQMFPDLALTAAGGFGALSRTGTLARIGENLADLADRGRTFNWADDTGAIDLNAWLRRDPIELSDGTELVAVSGEEQAAAVARAEALTEGPLKTSGQAATYQASVYGPTERLVPLPDGRLASVDGITAAYGGVVGDAKLVINPARSIYIPETISGSFSSVAVRRMDEALIKLSNASDAFGAGRPVEIVTNNPASAAVWEARMRALDIPRYVRIQV